MIDAGLQIPLSPGCNKPMLKCVAFLRHGRGRVTSAICRATFGSRSFPLPSQIACDKSDLSASQLVSALWGQLPRRLSTSRILAVQSPSREVLAGYDAQQIQVLEGLQPVRIRPGMYIGSTGETGLHHLIWEVVDNCIDEVQGGHAKHVKVEVDLSSGWVEVSDDGRGIPVDVHPKTKKTALETVLTVLHAGGKFGGPDSGYQVSGGLHGVGVSVVNALSEQLEVTVRREGKQYTQSFSRGVADSDLQEEALPKAEAKNSGTSIRFRYDQTIFDQEAFFKPETIKLRLRELAYLNNAATIHFRALKSENGAKPAEWTSFHFDGGIKEYVEWINRSKQNLHDAILISRKVDDVIVEIALQWCDTYSETLISFCNNVKTAEGGSHVDGLKNAMTRVFNAQARNSKALKDGDSNLSGDHVRTGMSAIISVKVPNPEFEGQTKSKLGNPEVRKLVERVINSDLADEFEADSSTFSLIAQKALQAFQASEAAKKARDLSRRKNTIVRSTLPGKLADCTSKDLKTNEIFIVEGDSAGGSAKQARDRQFQAILPLRGKILNVEKIDEVRLYDSKEISDMILALGLRIKDEKSKLRYGKIIILTDADVDGAHIRTLLLTFFFRHQPELFDKGHIFVGVPPLYKIESGRKEEYVYSEEDLQKAQKAVGGRPHIQRFKGLGEMMPEQLWQTTLDPETRNLRRLTVQDGHVAQKLFDDLMGANVRPRKELLQKYGSQLALEDLDI